MVLGRPRQREVAQDVVDVTLDRLARDDQGRSDRRVGVVPSDQRKNLPSPVGQRQAVSGGRPAQQARDDGVNSPCLAKDCSLRTVRCKTNGLRRRPATYRCAPERTSSDSRKRIVAGQVRSDSGRRKPTRLRNRANGRRV